MFWGWRYIRTKEAKEELYFVVVQVQWTATNEMSFYISSFTQLTAVHSSHILPVGLNGKYNLVAFLKNFNLFWSWPLLGAIVLSMLYDDDKWYVMFVVQC